MSSEGKSISAPSWNNRFLLLNVLRVIQMFIISDLKIWYFIWVSVKKMIVSKINWLPIDHKTARTSVTIRNINTSAPLTPTQTKHYCLLCSRMWRPWHNSLCAPWRRLKRKVTLLGTYFEQGILLGTFICSILP